MSNGSDELPFQGAVTGAGISAGVVHRVVRLMDRQRWVRIKETDPQRKRLRTLSRGEKIARLINAPIGRVEVRRKLTSRWRQLIKPHTHQRTGPAGLDELPTFEFRQPRNVLKPATIIGFGVPVRFADQLGLIPRFGQQAAQQITARPIKPPVAGVVGLAIFMCPPTGQERSTGRYTHRGNRHRHYRIERLRRPVDLNVGYAPDAHYNPVCRHGVDRW